MAIIAIVVSHLNYYVPSMQHNGTFLLIEDIIATCGLVLFFFLSGYSLVLKKTEFNGLDDLKIYVRKRIFKIYPIYWLFLVFAIIMGAYGWHDKYLPEMTALNLIITVLGLQILFPSILTDMPVWFVSAILLFYLLFPTILFTANKIRKSFTTSVGIISIAVFFVLVVIHFFTNMIDNRVLLYYWFFIAGTVLGRAIDLSQITLLSSLPFAIISAFALPLILFLPTGIAGYLFVIIIGIITIISMIHVSKMLKKYIWNNIQRSVGWVAPHTLSIYLFHNYLLHLAVWMVEGINPSLIPISVILIGIPLGLLFPPFIQIAVIKVVNYFITLMESKPYNSIP